jgi:hypothetical protein
MSVLNGGGAAGVALALLVQFIGPVTGSASGLQSAAVARARSEANSLPHLQHLNAKTLPAPADDQ